VELRGLSLWSHAHGRRQEPGRLDPARAGLRAAVAGPHAGWRAGELLYAASGEMCVSRCSCLPCGMAGQEGAIELCSGAQAR